MFHTILGIMCLIVGLFGLLQTYKNRYKINITGFFLKKDKYEVINEKKILRLQNIKSLFLALTFLIIGSSGLLWSSKIYILAAIITGASNYIFSNIGIKYTKLKPKVYL
jgi:hypothetical protein